MDGENPFEASGAALADGRNEGGELPPVPLEVRPILERSWELLQRHPGTIIGAILIQIAVSFVTSFAQEGAVLVVEGSTSEGMVLFATLFGLGLALVGFAVNTLLQLGTVRIFTRLARGLPATLTLLFGELPRLMSGIVASLFYVIAVMAGLVLLVVPGIVLALGLQLFVYALVDQDLDPMEALRESWRLTYGYKLTLLGVNLVMLLVSVAVIVLTCGLGFLAVVPILSLAQSVIYHSLVHLRGPRPKGDLL
jgi:uncharacterized membrane protein